MTTNKVDLKNYPKMPGGLVLCGSSRFYEEMQEYGRWAAKTMRMVMADVTLPERKTEDIETKSELMNRHKIAINAWCPMVIVYNGKEDYIGISTAMEIGQAYTTGKHDVIFLSHPTKIPELLALGLRVIERNNNIPECPNCNKPMIAAGMRARYDDKGNYLGVELDEPVYMSMECDI